MTDEKVRVLVSTIEKLYRRSATENIKKILSKTHSVDVATVLQGFSHEDRLRIFNFETDEEKKSEIITYLEPELQKSLLESLPHDESVQLIQLMDSDESADIIALLDEDLGNKILQGMGDEESEEVVDLMGYPEDSAGGIMNVEHFALNKELTVEQTIQAIQSEEERDSVLFYIYVINGNEQLIGVLSLKELLLSKKEQTLEEIMNVDVISVQVDTPQEAAANKVERYDFLSIPVVEESNKLVGIITVDDVIDVIREEAEEEILSMGQVGFDVDASVWEHFKTRLPWILFSFLGGAICFAVIYYFPNFASIGAPSFTWLTATAMIPLILALGATTGSQSTSIALGIIRSNRIDKGYFYNFLIKEILLSIVFSVLLGALTYGLYKLLFGFHREALMMGFVVSFQIMFSVLIGSFLPSVFNKLGLNSTAASIPFFTILVDVMAMFALFLSLNWL